MPDDSDPPHALAYATPPPRPRPVGIGIGIEVAGTLRAGLAAVMAAAAGWLLGVLLRVPLTVYSCLVDLDWSSGQGAIPLRSQLTAAGFVNEALAVDHVSLGSLSVGEVQRRLTVDYGFVGYTLSYEDSSPERASAVAAALAQTAARRFPVFATTTVRGPYLDTPHWPAPAGSAAGMALTLAISARRRRRRRPIDLLTARVRGRGV